MSNLPNSRIVVLSALLAIGHICSCATGPKPRVAASDDLFCETDADCEIVGYDIVGGACCSIVTEPRAICRAAADRYRARWAAACTGAVCTLDCAEVEVTMPEDWVAVCSGHACERRAAKFLPSPKSLCM
jgi:hypothetical protein